MFITPQHLPKGTIIKTSLYVQEGDEIVQRCSDEQKPNASVFVIDHVRVADTWTGRNYLAVTTTPKTKPLFDGDNFYTFNIDHITEIVSIGKKMDIRYESRRQVTKDRDGTYASYDVRNSIWLALNKLQPYNQFDLNKATQKAIQDQVFIGKKTSELKFGLIDRNGLERFMQYHCSKKKLKRWAKQNVNRFIRTQKEIQQEQQAAEEEMYKDVERDFDNQWISDESAGDFEKDFENE